jgi:tetratricopeptide (TPR) repeat protein
MPHRSTDHLYQLVRSLQKAEKRNFKLYVQRNSGNEHLKIVQLFDALDKQQEYDETALLRKLPDIKKQQLPNLKAHLYRQLLASLRLLQSGRIDMQLREQMDYASILYEKGLYLQSLKMLERIKETARAHHQVGVLVQVLALEKNIEALHITRSLHNRAGQLSAEAAQVTEKLLLVTQLSNLSLQLYGWYIRHGHARNRKDEDELETFFRSQIPACIHPQHTFYQKLYYYQAYCWYSFIRQDFLVYYRYTQKWVSLFDEAPLMIGVEPAHYIKGMHNLLNAHFALLNFSKYDATLEVFDRFAQSDTVRQSHNNTIQVFVYVYIAKINQHFLHGTFKEGLHLVPQIEAMLKEYAIYLDRHRILVFYYKFASLYFGNGDYDNTIKYLQKIINLKVDLRSDLQCYARLLHLIAHYELGNYDLLEYLTRSVYRFMSKMENLSFVEEEIFAFLREALRLTPHRLKPAFEALLLRLKSMKKSPYELRAFAYLDIVSWLESKVHNVPLQTILKNRYLHAQKAV